MVYSSYCSWKVVIMGVCQAKGTHTKEEHNPSRGYGEKAHFLRKNIENGSPVTSPRNRELQTKATHYLRLFLEGAESVFGGGYPFNSPDEQYHVSLTFLNSCVEVTRMKFRLKTVVIVDLIEKIAIEKKLKTILSILPDVKENCVDEGFARLLHMWFENNSGFSNTLDRADDGPVMVGKNINKNAKNLTGFSSILASYLRSAISIQAMNIFPKFVHDGDIMTVEQFGKFLRETQRTDVTDSQVREKYNYRFGGAIHRYNFNTYLGGLSTNCALDPLRTKDVWQDMTQPLTRYSVNTARIESEADLTRALEDSSRAFLLNLKKNEEGVLCSGTCPLQTILESIQKNGFVTNSYPIVLCLSPAKTISLELMDELACIITKDFSSLLAKGLMFEGSIISDPKFSPAALRKKVLLLGYQSRLKPFVGCFVADMNRDGLGVRVTDVVEGTPAAKGGLSKDDWLTHINGEAIQNKQHLRERLAKFHLGEEFTLRKENLEDIKIVVGGIVDTDDKGASASLSNILFLKYTDGNSEKPWETQVLGGKTIQNSNLKRKDLDDHFALFYSEGISANLDHIGIATEMGVQFIDTGILQEAQMWAHGRFVDNGGSGYLIKSDSGMEGTVTATVEIIAGPQEIKGVALTKGRARVYGAGSARVDGSKFTFKGCNDATVTVIDCEFAQNGGSFSFSAAFPLALLRSGCRVLPLRQTGGPKDLGVPTPSAYCYIRRDV
ncbi:hypothetical protein TCSYLVIO_003130 [Trypanosoma cruzi]|nr:hypothetical protein TCSYLVIO_003130 [Trypanosoma cruzi]RNF16238.1 phospholipase C, delta [Trypanosoma cruzi]